MKNLKIENGTAIYTGGGIYVCLGKLNNGMWFAGSDDCVAMYDDDVRKYDEDNDDLVCFDFDWINEHEVKLSDEQNEELWEAFKDFCIRLDKGEEGITDGFSELSNYLQGEVYKYIF